LIRLLADADLIMMKVPMNLPRRPAVWVGALLAVCLLPCVPAPAQLSKLDRKELIGSLNDQGMTELLARLKATEGAKLDPVEAALLDTALQLGAAADRNAPPAARAAALQAALDILRGTPPGTENNPEWDIYRGMWQTEVAERMVGGYASATVGLPPEFYEFGVTTKTQARQFAAICGDALATARSSKTLLEGLVARLPDRSDFVARFRDGLYPRMKEEYLKARTALVLAQSAYYLSLTEDDDPALMAAGAGNLPAGAGAGDVRTWLLKQALTQLNPLADRSLRHPAMLAQVRCLRGRVELAQGQLDPATADLQAVVAAKPDDDTLLTARLGLAAIAERRGQADAQQEQINAIHEIGLVKSAPALRLLTFDLLYRAQIKKGVAVPEAVKVYDKLTNDKNLTEEEGTMVRGFLYRRWFELYKDLDPATLPAPVQQGLGLLAIDEGLSTAAESQTAAQQGKDKLAAELMAKARPQLEKAQRILTALLDGHALAPAVAAQARLDLARATLYLKPGDVSATIDAARQMIALAKSQADLPKISETAIGYAVNLTHNMMVAAPNLPATDAEAIKKAYQDACAVLFSQYGNIADRERMDFVQWVLLPANDFDQAVAQLSKVPPGGEGYWPAREVILDCQVKRWEKEATPAAYDQAVATAEALRKDVADAPAGADKDTLLRAEAYARLKLADLDIAKEKNQEALEVLRGWEQRFSFDPALLASGQGKRVVALAVAGQTQQFQAAADAMLRQDPRDAAGIIDNVLNNLGQRIDALRRQAQETKDPDAQNALRQRVADLSDKAGVAADLLLAWAQTQKPDDLINFLGLPDSPINRQRVADLLDWKVPKVRSLVIAHKYQEALGILDTLAQNPNYKNYLPILNLRGEALFGLGGPENLDKARLVYTDLTRLTPADRKTRKFPAAWWNANMRLLEIADLRNEKSVTADIPDVVRRLTQNVDPNLGGEPYHSEFKRLENKYSIAGGGGPAPVPAPAPAAKAESSLGMYLAAGGLIGVLLLLLAGAFIFRMRQVKEQYRARARQAAAAAAAAAARKAKRPTPPGA
jgi:hypothetical protein